MFRIFFKYISIFLRVDELVNKDLPIACHVPRRPGERRNRNKHEKKKKKRNSTRMLMRRRNSSPIRTSAKWARKSSFLFPLPPSLQKEQRPSCFSFSSMEESSRKEKFRFRMKGKFRVRAHSWNAGWLAWIQRFNDVKTRGDEGTARDFFVSRRNFICLIGEGEGRRGGTPLESLERSCTRSFSLSKGERIHWRNTRAWLLRLAPVVDQPDRYYAISSGLEW